MFSAPPRPFVTPPVWAGKIVPLRFSAAPAFTWMMPSVAARPNAMRGTLSVFAPPVTRMPPLDTVSCWKLSDAPPTMSPVPLIFSPFTTLTVFRKFAFVVVASEIKVFPVANPKPMLPFPATAAAESVSDVGPVMAMIVAPCGMLLPVTVCPMARPAVLTPVTVALAVVVMPENPTPATVAFRSAPAPTYPVNACTPFAPSAAKSAPPTVTRGMIDVLFVIGTPKVMP